MIRYDFVPGEIETTDGKRLTIGSSSQHQRITLFDKGNEVLSIGGEQVGRFSELYRVCHTHITRSPKERQRIDRELWMRKIAIALMGATCLLVVLTTGITLVTRPDDWLSWAKLGIVIVAALLLWLGCRRFLFRYL